MDETKTWWFQWVAENARYLFWGVWGVGVGAFGTALLTAVGEDVVRIYMAVLTVLMGGALGLVSSRAMAARADAIKLRRKANLTRLTLQQASQTAQAIVRETGCYAFRPMSWGKEWFINIDFDKRKPAKGWFDHSKIDEIVRLLEDLATITAEPPDFDELVHSDEDINHAHTIAIVFRTAARRICIPANVATHEGKRRFVEARFLTDTGSFKALQLMVNALTRADAYFSNRKW